MTELIAILSAINLFCANHGLVLSNGAHVVKQECIDARWKCIDKVRKRDAKITRLHDEYKLEECFR